MGRRFRTKGRHTHRHAIVGAGRRRALERGVEAVVHAPLDARRADLDRGVRAVFDQHLCDVEALEHVQVVGQKARRRLVAAETARVPRGGRVLPRERVRSLDGRRAVSYTHLTLPTKA